MGAFMQDTAYRALSLLRLAAGFDAAASSPQSHLASLARTKQAHMHGVASREDALHLAIDVSCVLASLLPDQRTILVAHGVQGHTFEEIARAMVLSPRTIFTRWNESLAAFALEAESRDLLQPRPEIWLQASASASTTRRQPSHGGIVPRIVSCAS